MKLKTTFSILCGVLLLLALVNHATAQTARGSGQRISGSGISLTTSGTSGASTLVGSVLNVPVYSGGASALSALTSGTITNTIDSTSFAQTWNWSALAGNTALSLVGTTTGAGKAFSATITGASNTGYAGYFSNTATMGYALYVNGGSNLLSSVPLGAGLTITQGVANASPLTSTSTGLYTQTFVNTFSSTHTVAASESGGFDIFAGTTTETFNLPQGATAGFLNGTSYNFLNASTSALTLSTTGGSYFYGLGGTTTSTTEIVNGGGYAFCGVDANGNYPCAGFLNSTTSGSVNSGTAGYVAYYATTGTAISGQSALSFSTSGVATFADAAIGAQNTPALSTATFTPNFSAANGFDFVLVHASCPCTIANPTNLVAGQTGMIEIDQSATGSDTIGTWGSSYKFASATAPTLSTSASAQDYFSYYVRDSTHIIISGGVLNAH